MTTPVSLLAPTTAVSPSTPPPAVAPARITLTVTVAGLFDVLTNTVRALGTDPTLPTLTRLRLHLADGRLHATGTDRFRIHRDWTPLLDNTPARLPDPLFLPAADVATLRALLRRRLAPGLRGEPATLTVGPSAPDVGVRLVRLTVGTQQRDRLIVASHAEPLPYPDITAPAATTPTWGATGTVRINPRFLDDAARLTHDGRPVPRHAGIQLDFRVPRADGCLGAVRITHPARPSWTGDVMPIRTEFTTR